MRPRAPSATCSSGSYRRHTSRICGSRLSGWWVSGCTPASSSCRPSSAAFCVASFSPRLARLGSPSGSSSSFASSSPSASSLTSTWACRVRFSAATSWPASTCSFMAPVSHSTLAWTSSGVARSYRASCCSVAVPATSAACTSPSAWMKSCRIFTSRFFWLHAGHLDAIIRGNMSMLAVTAISWALAAAAPPPPSAPSSPSLASSPDGPSTFGNIITVMMFFPVSCCDL
mmetsp:Transcript_19543/g.26909  ORF Transcript_19543/g.26909 Transcript_19543/m.26909 type:complete len:229 (-) Transcript_19543:321-1007(-)